jgi:hypothetical protein
MRPLTLGISQDATIDYIEKMSSQDNIGSIIEMIDIALWKFTNHQQTFVNGASGLLGAYHVAMVEVNNG